MQSIYSKDFATLKKEQTYKHVVQKELFNDIQSGKGIRTPVLPVLWPAGSAPGKSQGSIGTTDI